VTSNNKGTGYGIAWLRAHVSHRSDDCLQWPLSCDDKGYGILRFNGRKSNAARLMCEMAHGLPPTPDHECAHSCGRGHKACTNPRHLAWKTRAENQQDRRQHGTHGKPGVVGRSKMTPEQIAEIRKIGRAETQTALARRFNCTPSNISKILGGARWKKTPKWLTTGLTREDIEVIKAAKGKRQGLVLAAKFGVSHSVIYRIQSGSVYVHLR
jgi:hypothetical protein